MSGILVVYGTKTGCTARIAEKIAETLTQTGAAVHVAPASETPDASEFDAIVVGSGVRAGNWHKQVKEWVAANAEALKARPTAFFTVGLTMGVEPEKAEEVRAYTDSLTAETGVIPLDIGLFAGMNEPAGLSLPERLIIKMVKAPQGDFRDFEAVARWASDLAPRLTV